MEPSAYGPFEFSRIDCRPRLEWPNKARVAFWVVVNVEFFALNRPMPGDSGERPKASDATPQVRNWSQRDYGNRVGFARLRDVLSAHGIRATVALNSDVCDYHPELVSNCVDLGWELMGHCRTNTARLNEIPPDQERDTIRYVMDRIAKATGKRPEGWLGAGLQETWNTLDYLAEAGCRYVADWVNDDQPYEMQIGTKKMISVPYTYELNDMSAIVRSKYSAAEFECMIKDQFDVLYEEGASSGRVFTLSLHPFIMGQPHRIPALRRALDYIDKFDGVWKVTGSEIAAHFAQSQATK